MSSKSNRSTRSTNRKNSVDVAKEESEEVQYLTRKINEMQTEISESTELVKKLTDIIEAKVPVGEVVTDQHGNTYKFVPVSYEKEMRHKAKELESQFQFTVKEIEVLKEKNKELIKFIADIKHDVNEEKKERDKYDCYVTDSIIRKEKSIHEYEKKYEQKELRGVEKTKELQYLEKQEMLLKENIAKTLAKIKASSKPGWKF